MTRRGMTLAVSTSLLMLLMMLAGALRVPYIALTPGPVINTLGVTEDKKPIISVSGRKTFPPRGRLDLTTVSVRGAPGFGGLTLVDALRYWVNPKVAVVPREVQYPPGRDEKEIEAANTQQMVDSQDAAELAALRLLGEKVSTSLLVVDRVERRLPADRVLAADDQIESVDGKPVKTALELREAITARKPGEPVTIGYTRGGKKMSSTLKTVPDKQDASRAIVGIGTSERCPCKSPYDITIALGEDVGGPSAGLMFALAIVDTVTPGELTGGVHFAGTGTIDPGGGVGPIGGIQQKLHGARDKGAAHFLVPAGNWEAAQKSPTDGMALHKIATLEEAAATICGISKASGAPCQK